MTWLRNIGMFQKMLLTPLLILMVFLVVQGLSIWQEQRQARSVRIMNDQVFQSYRLMVNLEQALNVAHKDIKDSIGALSPFGIEDARLVLAPVLDQVEGYADSFADQADIAARYQPLQTALKDYMAASEGLQLAMEDGDSSAESSFTARLEKGFAVALSALQSVREVDDGEVSRRALLLQDQFRQAFIRNLASVVGAVLLALVAAWWIGRAVSRRMKATNDAVAALKDGDLEVEITEVTAKDELGSIARAIDSFREKLVERDELQKVQLEKAEREKEESQRLVGLSRDFDANAEQSLQHVSQAIAEIRAIAGDMVGQTEEVDQQSGEVSRLAGTVSVNINDVAAATAQLSTAIGEISEQVARAVDVAQATNSDAMDSSDKVRALDQAADKIGTVVGLINDVAEQTNLLALNATIEAARAGEAGKGFAVVANEVKGLATQTAKATGEISQLISEIQTSVKDTVGSIHRISEQTTRMTEISSIIAAAVEEQNATTDNIAGNAQNASGAVDETARRMGRLSELANSSRELADRARNQVGAVDDEAGTVKELVSRFLADMRKG